MISQNYTYGMIHLMSNIVQDIFNAQNDSGIYVLNLGKLNNFDAIKEEALEIIKTKPGTTILERDDGSFYRDDDYIIKAEDHKKLYDQLHGGYRSFQLLRPEPGWTDIYYGLSSDTDYNQWKFWAEDTYPNIAKSLKSYPSCFNCCIGGFLPHSRFTIHREPIIKQYHDKWFMICRFHIPLTTNSKCSNYIGDGLYHFDEGNMYFFNVAGKHDGRNESDVPRYHLVYDLILTEQVINMLKNAETVLPNQKINLEVNPNRDVKSKEHDIFIAKENPFLEI